jgi:hypothetical protein
MSGDVERVVANLYATARKEALVAAIKRLNDACDDDSQSTEWLRGAQHAIDLLREMADE